MAATASTRAPSVMVRLLQIANIAMAPARRTVKVALAMESRTATHVEDMDTLPGIKQLLKTLEKASFTNKLKFVIGATPAGQAAKSPAALVMEKGRLRVIPVTGAKFGVRLVQEVVTKVVLHAARLATSLARLAKASVTWYAAIAGETAVSTAKNAAQAAGITPKHKYSLGWRKGRASILLKKFPT